MSSVATAMNATVAPCELVAFVVAEAGRVSEGAVASVIALASPTMKTAIAIAKIPMSAQPAPSLPQTTSTAYPRSPARDARTLRAPSDLSRAG